MLQNIKKRSEGFTIIEVMIVLAIAGLIMLIVFLAVPALQRNARNTQRNSDASKVLGDVQSCLGNHNGQVSSCNTNALVGVDTTKLQVLTTYSFGAAAFSLTDARVVYGSKCNAAGDNVAGGQPRDVVVTFQVETGTATTNRCIGG